MGKIVSNYLAKHESPFKQFRSFAHFEVSMGHFLIKHCPSTPTLCPYIM